MILIADKDRQISDHLEMSFGDEDVGILRVDSGEACLDIMSNNKVDVAIIDSQPSDMSGLQLLYRIKSVEPDLCVIFTTTQHSPELEIKARREGILYYFVRSGHYENLDKFIRKVLQKGGKHFGL